MSPIYEFAVDSAVMPSNFSPQSAVHRIGASWEAFRMFTARMPASEPTAPPNLALVDTLAARLTSSDNQEIADASLKRLALKVVVRPGAVPRSRLNGRLMAGPPPYPASRLTLEPCCADDGTHAVTATMTGELPNGDLVTTVGFGFSTEAQHGATRAATHSAAHAIMHRLLAEARPGTLGNMALFQPRRPAGSATSASSPGTISDAAPRLGTSRRSTQWTNDMTALFGYAPLEQRLGHSYADVMLPSGRSLELQHVDIDPATIMRRRCDHSTHGAGDPKSGGSTHRKCSCRALARGSRSLRSTDPTSSLSASPRPRPRCAASLLWAQTLSSIWRTATPYSSQQGPSYTHLRPAYG